MAGGDEDKTEEATPKQREEARSKGQVANSTEFVAAVMLCTTIGSFLFLGTGLASASGQGVVDGMASLATLGPAELDAGQFAGLMVHAGSGVAAALALLVAPVLLVGFVVSYGQVGLRLTPRAVTVDLNKINPISGAKKILGPRGAVRTLLGLLKVILLGTVIAMVAWREVPRLTWVAGTDAVTTVAAVGGLMLKAATAGAVVFLMLSIIDLVYQRFQHSKDLRMSRKDIKDEHKNSEGDPQVRARIRQVQREMATRRMMDDVPDATVVITNPTHYAVALRYQDGRDAAPTVVAKGLDQVALRIREIAREHGVMIFEEPPLARALHRTCDVGDAVPEDLFEAVAKVLAYVYRSEGRSVTA